MKPDDGRRRVVLEHVHPEVDGGRFPIKRVEGESVRVEVDLFADGHDRVDGVLLVRHASGRPWREEPLEPLGNDRFAASFVVDRLGRWEYTVEGWVDAFGTWRHGLEKKVEAGLDVAVDLEIGAELVRGAAGRARGAAADELGRRARDVGAASAPAAGRAAAALDPELARLMRGHADRGHATRRERPLEVVVEPRLAGCSAWYEMFPRSAGPGTKHGTFADAARWLPYVVEMGFDVVYLPPVHPVGRTRRKGRDNAVEAAPGDPGSPWAIGALEGGHTSVHPELGTLEDFERFVGAAREAGLAVALDVAFQCSPDHPYVREHPEWFRFRPDGTVQFAENPPKKYEDIFPFDFDSEAWSELWDELRSVFDFWIARGVRVFRVDNPHTKPFGFWEWAIRSLHDEHPDVVFLAEAFTRPKIMYRLAKLGFSQSYTYFTWRNTAHELRAYLEELTGTDVREFFRPNFWPNTPDILPEVLQNGGRPAFVARAVLAGTLSSNWGIYGPAFELLEREPRARGSEEYLDSEKYEIKDWNRDRADSLREILSRLNRIRRENPALHSNRSLRFLDVDNEQLLAYVKHTESLDNVVLTVVNLDPFHVHSGWVEVPLEPLGIDPEHPYQAHDLITGARYLWNGSRNYVELHPTAMPAHVFRLRRRIRSEQDFDTYM